MTCIGEGTYRPRRRGRCIVRHRATKGTNMAPIRRILVAVKDPTVRSSPAIAKGAQLAHAFRAELVLFHAITGPASLNADISLIGTGLADLEDSARRDCLARLETLARRLRKSIASVTVSADWMTGTGAPSLRGSL